MSRWRRSATPAGRHGGVDRERRRRRNETSLRSRYGLLRTEMPGYLGEVMEVSGGLDLSFITMGLFCLGALGIFALLRDNPSNDDDDSSPGGGIMQPVA